MAAAEPSPHRRELRALAALAVPLVGGQLAHMGMGFVDTLMIGRVSTVALAGVAVGHSLWSPASLLALGILLAIPASVARLAARDLSSTAAAIGEVMRQSLWIATGLAGLLVLLLVHADRVLPLVRVDPAILPEADAYLAGLAWGVPAWAGTLALRFGCEGLGDTRPTLWLSVFGLPLDAVANWVLIYGRWGVPALGTFGCGLATALVWWAQLGALAWWIRRSRRLAPLRAELRPEGPRFARIRSLLSLGIPIGFTVFFEVALFGATGLLVASLGPVPAAAHQVALNFASIVFMVPLGIAMALTVRVGRAFGEVDREGALRAATVGTALAMGAQCIAITLMLTASETIARIYTPEDEVVSLAVLLIRMAAAFQLSDGLQVCAAAALRGLHDTRVPMLLTFCSYWAIGLPAAWWFGLGAGGGAAGVWVGLIVGLTLAAILLGLRLRHRTRPEVFAAAAAAA